MKNILALGGSNSKTSINKTLATYVADQIENSKTTVLDLNDFDIPLYSPDIEIAHGVPNDVVRFSQTLAWADGLVISLAEYNGSYAAAFKNLLDWLSRIDRKVWHDKPMLLMATSTGEKGGALVLQAAKVSFPRLGGNIITDFSLPSFDANFSAEGITDAPLRATLQEKIKLLQDALST